MYYDSWVQSSEVAEKIPNRLAWTYRILVLSGALFAMLWVLGSLVAVLNPKPETLNPKPDTWLPVATKEEP